MNKAFILLKPEVKNYLEDLDKILIDNKFSIISRHPVKDWELTSRMIYTPQLSVNKMCAYEFNAYIWLSQYFFGNQSVVFILDKEGTSLENTIKDLFRLKIEFRSLMNDKGKAIKIFLNANELKTEGADKIGIEGKLTVGEDKQFDGRWDDYYFKYVHTSDPSLEVLNREVKVLESLGILDQRISESEWDIMKKLRILTHPSGDIEKFKMG